MKKLMTLLLLVLASTMMFAFAQEETEEQEVQGEGVLDALRQNEDLLVFREALLASDLAGELEGEGDFTVFAPTNEAFSDVSVEAMDAEVLGTYVVEGIYTVDILQEMLAEQGGAASLQTIGGGELSLVLDEDGSIVIGGVARLGEDFITANGVVIPIDNVIPAVAVGGATEEGAGEEEGTGTAVAAFSDFDTDVSGGISEEEFNAGVEEFYGGESQTAFSDLDTDQSGELNEEEFGAFQ